MSTTVTIPDGYEACEWADADRSDLEGMRVCLLRDVSGKWVVGEAYPGDTHGLPLRRIPLPQKPCLFCDDTYDLESDPCLDKALTELREAKELLRISNYAGNADAMRADYLERCRRILSK